MNTDRISLLVTCALIAVSTTSCSDHSKPVAKAPSTQEQPPKAATDVRPAPKAEAQPEARPEVVIETESLEELTAAPSYPFGEPKISKEADGSHWIALLPTNIPEGASQKMTIRSVWPIQPEVFTGFPGEPAGAISLTDQEHVLLYIYKPELAGFKALTAETVLDEMINKPAELLKGQGLSIDIVDLNEGNKIDKTIQSLGVEKDAQRQLIIKKEDKVLQSQFFRVLVGKDFIILGLAIGADAGAKEDGVAFLNGITLERSK